MDIITVANGNHSLSSYRIDGERIYNLNLGNSSKGGSNLADDSGQDFVILYKDDGKFFLAVDSKTLKIYDTNNGKLISSFDNNFQDNTIEFISWCLEGNEDNQNDTGIGNLYEYIEDSLPKIPPVDSNITGNGNVEKLIESYKEDNTSNFIIYGNKGIVNLLVFGLFNIENILEYNNTNFASRILSHDYNKNNISSQFFLAIDTENNLVIKNLELGFLGYENNNDKIQISKKMILISNFLNYLNLFKKLITKNLKDSNIFLDYDFKIVNLLQEEIDKNSEKANVSSIDELYDLLLTGMITESIKQWLEDYLGDRGLKRWYQLASQCYENNKKLVFHFLIPIIERLLLIYNNFVNLSKQEPNEKNFESDEIIAVLKKILRNLYIFLNDLNLEFLNFKNFNNWLSLLLKKIMLLNNNDDDNDDEFFEIEKKLNNNINIEKISNFLNSNFKNSCILSKQKDLNAKLNDVEQLVNYKIINLKKQLKQKIKINDKNTLIIDQLKDNKEIDQSILKLGNDNLGYIITHNKNEKLHLNLFRFNIGSSLQKVKKLKLNFNQLFSKYGTIKKFEIIDNKELIILITNYDKEAQQTLNSIVLSIDYTSLDCLDEQEGETNITAVLKSRSFNDGDFIPVDMTCNGNTNRRIGFLVGRNMNTFMLFDLDEEQDEEEEEEIIENGEVDRNTDAMSIG
ncbi:hypothetical protein PACTADRAFT_47520 [Pachysolen tannophilus NRRL Y-2460]|uniref:Anaphase-promoting complex subunit 4 n=1 Tax=Pachysolen tannophilus NRRL Y-2460 TaxID=669874 RepID=A0A1E4U0W9_PACTA|nr:hypothetical protein PACTADRAFT_47520 [Pachysolen tannophilus NRRL Y-2460]